MSAFFCVLPSSNLFPQTTTEPQVQELQDPDKTKEPRAPGARYSAEQILRRIDENPDNSTGIWNELFESTSNGIPDLILSEAVALLHEQQRYNAAVEGLLSAIRHNQAAPWMYDVLAHEMKLAGRSKRDIARVIASRVDFAVSDVPQLLIAVAMLSRFEAWQEANELAREASELDPLQPDVWLLGRGIADKSEDLQHRVRTRCGILRHVWTDGYQVQHEEALKVITEIASTLEKQGQNSMAELIRQQLADASAVDLQVLVSWVGNADIDLNVTEPGGEICNFRNRITSSMGRLVREDGTIETGGKDSGRKYTEHYLCHTAPGGTYEVSVRLVNGKVVGGTAIVELIRHAGTAAEHREVRQVTPGKEDVRFKVDLNDGRANTKN